MAGKITTILAKKEAETYCLHGLHKEALHIYRKLLTASPNIAPAFKAGIEHQIEKISAELESDELMESTRLTAADIIRVKKGWGKEATESDMLICAQAFHQIGYHKEALLELGGMLQKGCATDNISTLLAECLVRMCPSSQVVEALEKFNDQHLNHPEDRFHLSMVLAEEMVDLKQPDHAATIVAHLQEGSAAGKRDSQHLAAIADRIGDLDTGHSNEAPDSQSQPSEASSSAEKSQEDRTEDSLSPSADSPRSIFRWLAFFRKKS